MNEELERVVASLRRQQVATEDIPAGSMVVRDPDDPEGKMKPAAPALPGHYVPLAVRSGEVVKNQAGRDEVDVVAYCAAKNEQNALVVIGMSPNRRCYLNVTTDEAIDRYVKEVGGSRESIERKGLVTVFTFGDHFECFDAWAVIETPRAA